MSYTTNLEIQDEIIGKMGLGVDYYKGEKGEPGKTPVKGVDYFTDAEIADIEKEVASQVTVGAKGEDGKSAYQLAVEAGYEGSETEWLASLKGKDGKDGTNGKDGKTPVKGVDYFTTAEIQQIENEAATKVDLSDYAKTADLSTVASSGSYNDLSNKPSIPEAYKLPVASATVLGGVKVGSGLSITNGVLAATGGGTADSVDWSKIQNKPTFADVATSGSYNDLTNKPTIPEVPTKVSAFENDKGYLTEHQSLTDYAKKTEIPTVPTKVSAFENDKGYLTEHQSLEGYAKTADLATIAVSGSYNDLADKPTIPSTTGLATETYVDGKIAEIDIPVVPTNVSAFTNDAGYLTEHQSLTEYAKKADIPAPYTLPTASTSTLGGVKVDGSTITISDGVISSVGGSGGSEPEKYIKDASVSGNTLTLTKKDDTTVSFTPSGSGGSGGESYVLPVASSNTLGGIKVPMDESIATSKGSYCYINKEDYLYVPLAESNKLGVVTCNNTNGLTIGNTGYLSMAQASKSAFGTVKLDGTTIKAKNSARGGAIYVPTATTSSLGVVEPDGEKIIVNANGIITVDESKLSISASNGLPSGGGYPQILMKNGITDFDSTWVDIATVLNYAGISTGVNDWSTTTYIEDSNLFNAREMAIYWEYNNQYSMNYYNFFYDFNVLGNYQSQTFNVRCDYNNGDSSWYYDGSSINSSNMNIQVIYYKT